MSAEIIQRPEVRISEKNRINGIPVPNGWGQSRVSAHWYPPGGPWHGHDIKRSDNGEPIQCLATTA